MQVNYEHRDPQSIARRSEKNAGSDDIDEKAFQMNSHFRLYDANSVGRSRSASDSGGMLFLLRIPVDAASRRIRGSSETIDILS